MANSNFSEIPSNFSQPAVNNSTLNWADIASEPKFKYVQAMRTEDASIPAQPPELPSTAHDFTMTNDMYESARMFANVGAMYGNYIVRTGRFNGAPVCSIFASTFADDYVDKHYFKDVQRGAISTYADVAATGIAFLPQRPTVRAAEMVGVHTAGMYAEEHEAEMAKVIKEYV